MSHPESANIALFLFQLGIMLGLARLLGELARRFRQPPVVGEILAGVLLGPTVLGTLAPGIGDKLFSFSGPGLAAMEGLTTVAVALLLLVAGIEINLGSVWRQRRSALSVSALGIAMPFVAGVIPVLAAPGFFGFEGDANQLFLALFLGTALSISALPVIARTLMDLNLLKSDLGMLVVASAAINDLIGWLLFSAIVSVMGNSAYPGRSPVETIIIIVIFTIAMLTIVRSLFHRTLPWLERTTVWPGGILGWIITLTLIGAAFTEWMGIHAVFGAFLVGVAAGDTEHLTERTKDVISQFAMNIFAPLFFAFIGLRINFATNFDLTLALVLFLLATIGKVVGCGLGARLSGHSGREALAIGFGMNSRGTMEIILGLLALELGVIDERLFVGLVIMAIGTSVISGPLMELFLHDKRPLTLPGLLNPQRFVARITGTSPREVIEELAAAAAREIGIEPGRIASAVWEREQITGTGIGSGIAVPHARLGGLNRPLVIAGKTLYGVDFDTADGAPVHLVFLILTPLKDNRAQLQILADIARRFTHTDIRTEALKATTYESFLAAVTPATTGVVRQ